MFKQTDIRKLLYGIGIITLVLMAMLYLVWNSGSDYNPNLSYQTAATDSMQVNASQNQSMTGYLFKVIFVTIFVIAVLLVGAKWYGKLNKFTGSPSFIKILSKQNIGQKQYLLLIAVEQKKLLVGVTENSINHIADMGEHNESDDAKYNTITDTTSFSSVLNYFKKGKDE